MNVVSTTNEAAFQPRPIASVGRLLSKKEVVALTGTSAATISRWSGDEKNPFPASLQIGPNRVAWTELSIAEWLQRVASANAGGQY